MKNIMLMAVMVALLSACSTMRLGHQGEIKDSSGAVVGTFAMEKSYSVNHIKQWCIVTGIFFGGGCWWYTILPNTNHRKQFYREAMEKIKQQTNREQLTFDYDGIKQVNWDDGAEFFELKLK